MEQLESRLALANSGVGFDGISILDEGTERDPPDPVGAAGPNSFVQAVNSALAIFDKTSGSVIGGSITSLAEFFGQPGTGLDTSESELGDPVVIYNNLSERFAVGSYDIQTDSFGDLTASYFDFAISKSSDPKSLTSSDWDFFQYNTDDDPGTDVYFGDFPKIGFNSEGSALSENPRRTG